MRLLISKSCLYNKYLTLLNAGKGAVRLADAVLRAVEEPVEFKFLYDVKVSVMTVFPFSYCRIF